MSPRASHRLATIVRPLHLNGLDDKALVTRQPPQVTVLDPLNALQRALHMPKQPIGSSEFSGNHFFFQASNVMHLDS